MLISGGANGVCLVGSNAEQSHFMLDRVLRRAGLTREAFGFHGVEGLQPDLQISNHIKAIVTLGDQPLIDLIGEPDAMRWRGRPVFLKSYGVWCIPTLAPSDLLAKRKAPGAKKKPIINPPRLTRLVINDLWKGTLVAEHGFDRKTDRLYVYDPAPAQWKHWVDTFLFYIQLHPEGFLSFDIETPYKSKKADESEWEENEFDSTILRISFSYGPYTAVTMPWGGPWMDGIRTLLEHPCSKVVWNGVTFDVPVVQTKGITVGGRVFDFMDGWHLLQSDLPKGLEAVTAEYTDLLPWKHMNGSDPQLYSCIDADAALRNALGIQADLIAAGQWGTFMRHAVLLSPILVEAGKRGNVIDEDARVAMEAELVVEQAALLAEVQLVVPDVLRPRKRYKKLPKDIHGRRFEFVEAMANVKVCSHCQLPGVTKGKHFKGGKKNECKAAGASILTVLMKVFDQCDELLDFNPNSSDQMLTYMRHFGHPVGKKRQGDGEEDTDSADKKHLTLLVKKYGHKHPLYKLALRASLISKALGTYVRGLAPDASGRIHTTYKNTPSTWRLASADVNLQNQGKRTGNPYAKRSRRLIIASPGHVLVQADSSSIEAVYVGHEMGDANYISLAKQGIHGWLCCQKYGWPFTDDNVDRIKSEHHEFYDQMKTVNHLTNYGGTPPVLVEQYPDLFPTLKSARDAQQFVFDLLPQLAAWHHDLRVRAQKETFLQSAWMHRHFFYDVFTKGRDGKIRLGKDSKRTIAFVPQNGAGSFMRDNLLIMGTSTGEVTEFHPLVPPERFDFLYSGFWRQFMPANVSVHDGYTLDVPKHLQDDAVSYLEALLTRPVYELGGLQVGCEIEVGQNWLDMERVRKVRV